MTHWLVRPYNMKVTEMPFPWRAITLWNNIPYLVHCSSPKLAVKLAVVICEKVQKAKFRTVGGFMHSFILLEQLVSFLPLLAKILNNWWEWQNLELDAFLFKSKDT